jgi:Secretion system C-terminal sorting domain
LLLVLISAFYTNEVKAQVPGGSCATAVAIGGTGTIPNCSGSVSFTDFTTDGAVPSCITGTYKRDGWYSFTNLVAQNVTISASSTTASSNLIIQVFGVCGGAELGCANNFPANGAQTEGLSIALGVGTFYVKVTNYSTSTPANMTCNVCIYPTPVNNDCGSPTTLTPSAPSAACSPIAGTTGGGTPQALIPALCTPVNSNNDDVWYTFVATATSHVITVAPTATMDPVIQVYSNSPCTGTGTSIYCANASGAGLPEVATLTGLLTIGTTYWVRVYDLATTVPLSNTFNICIQTPPVNDNCTGAIPLTPSATCVPITGDVNVATFSGVAGCGTSNPDDDVWYSFTATGTSHTINVTGSANFDPGFEVFTGTCAGGLTSILCNAPGGGPGATLNSSFATLMGTTYYVRVFDYGTGSPLSTTFTICILNPPPANDNCGGAIALTPLSITCNAGQNQLTGDVSGATQSIPGNCAGNANDDVWYTFTTTATANQPYLITATGTGVFDPVLEVFSGTCSPYTLTPIGGACVNATAGGGTESVTLTTGVQLLASTTYYIRVYDFGAGYPANTTFTICVRIPPINDNCPGITLPVWGTAAAPAYCGGSTAGNWTGASASGYAATCGGTPNNDVFFNFVATAASHIITVVPCAGSDVVIQGYKTSCGTGLPLGCANAGGAGVTEVLTVTGLTVGVTYWIRVYDFNGVSAPCNIFTICISTPPANDPCTAPVTLTPSTACVTTAGTVSGSTQSLAPCGGTDNGDVWYTFNAGAAQQTITVAPTTAGMNPVFQLFSTNPCGGAGTSVQCVNNAGVGATESQLFSGLTPGAQYWIRVYDFAGAMAAYNFNICVVTPLNTSCATAISVVCGGTYTGNSNIGVANAPASCTSNAGGNPGVWFVFAGTGSNVVASLCGSSYDTQIYVYSSTAACTGLACVAGNDDSGGICGLQSITTFGSTAGVNYYIFVCGFSAQTGAFTLNLSCVTPPVNDQCSGAIPLDCSNGTNAVTTYSGSTVQASPNGDITGCQTATALYPTGLWYSINGWNYATTPFTLSLCGASFNTQMAVWSTPSSCTGPFTCVAGNDDFCGTASQVSFTAASGNMYYVEVYGFYTAFYSGPATGTFTLSVSGNLCVLPIELLSFTGEPAGNRNLLKWTTATETNNDYFTIEKSNDAVGWMTVTRVNGAGNSTQVLNYSTYDNEPYPGTTYYRLKQTDYNGAYTYSSIISVSNDMSGVSVNNVHPNPTNDDVSFDLNSGIKGDVQIILMDYTGRIVSDETQNVSEGTTVINTKMGTLSKGIYSMKVIFDQAGYVSVTKVVKD